VVELALTGGEAPVAVAFSDVHSPRYVSVLSEALKKYSGPEPCLVFMAGDLVDKGKYLMLAPVLRLVRSRFPRSRLVAVFGNEEYESVRGRLRSEFPEVEWLDDEVKVYECGGVKVAVVGTQGALERPTRWQARNMPHLYKVYRERPRIVARLLREARNAADVVVLLSHYGLSRATVVGEDPRIWPYLYSSLMERVLSEARPDVAVHGHAHMGTPRALVAGVPVFNVALPLNRRLVRVLPPEGFQGEGG
jgi:predicted phosphodiesterase